MARNESHLTPAKFAEAEKYAPNWGRLHLKWGEALAFAGKPADAKAQFARAAALDLTPSEKAERNEAVDPVGISLALSGASRSEADAYLRDQRHHMHEQLKQIHLEVWE